MRWSIGKRVAALSTLAVLVAVLVGGIGYIQAGAAARQGEVALSVANVRAMVIDAQHTSAVVYADANILSHLDAGDARTSHLAEMDSHAGELRDHFADLKTVNVDATVNQQLSGSFLPAIQTILDLADAIHTAAGVVTPAQTAAVQTSWDTFDKNSGELGTVLDAAAGREEAALAKKSSDARAYILIVAIIGALAVAGASWTFTRLVAAPVRRTRELLLRVADGDFTQRLRVRSNDDLADMGKALNTTIERFGKALASISGEAQRLQSASARLDTVSARMADGAQRVSDDIAAANDSAEGINTDVGTVAAGTETMHLSIGEITRSAAEATEIVAEAVAYADTANTTIGELDTSSSQIGEVAKVISAIAAQTNLLALNATIEAARAGEQGKGFAVVAGEVKELATQTAKATEDIGRRISTIQRGSLAAVEALRRISGTITRIADIQQVIALSVDHQATATTTITTSVQRATTGTTTIVDRIATVRRSSDETTSAAAETRDASRELAASSEGLRRVVAQFRVA